MAGSEHLPVFMSVVVWSLFVAIMIWSMGGRRPAEERPVQRDASLARHYQRPSRRPRGQR